MFNIFLLYFIHCFPYLPNWWDFQQNNLIFLLYLQKISHLQGSENICCLRKIQNRYVPGSFKKTKKLKHTHNSPLLEELHWLPVAQRAQFRTLVHTFKSLNNLSPSYLSCLLHLLLPSSPQAVCLHHLVLHQYPFLLCQEHAAFSTTAIRLWNKLPAATRDINNLSSFKRSLKSDLVPL